MWTHHNPVRVLAGEGALQQVGAGTSSGQWLLVTTPGATCRGLSDRIGQLLRADQSLLVHDQVHPNPELDELDELKQRFACRSIAGILALGGGSALDTGKVLSVILADRRERPLHETLRGAASRAWERCAPLIAIPTTAGTGSEVTPFATVWDRSGKKKYSVAGAALFPVRAILDPCLTASLPRDETLYSGLDACSHALESLWNRNRTPVSEAFALQALRLAVDSLPRVLARAGDLPARAGMQQAGMLAGQAIAQTRTAIAHSMSYPITSHYGVPHGLACSFTLPWLIEQYRRGAGPHEQPVLDAALGLLRSLALDKEIRRWTGDADLSLLCSEMLLPGRADNYTGDAGPEVILEHALRWPGP